MWRLMNNYILTADSIHIIYVQAITQLVLLKATNATILCLAFAAPFCEINTLLDVGFIQVRDNRYLVELFFGGDMKVYTIIVVHS